MCRLKKNLNGDKLMKVMDGQQEWSYTKIKKYLDFSKSWWWPRSRCKCLLHHQRSDFKVTDSWEMGTNEQLSQTAQCSPKRCRPLILFFYCNYNKINNILVLLFFYCQKKRRSKKHMIREFSWDKLVISNDIGHILLFEGDTNFTRG